MDILIIENSDFLLRRVPIDKPSYFKQDGTLSSLAFRPSSKNRSELSVDLEKLATYEKSILDPKRFALCKIQASKPRNLSLDCIHAPIESNYAHSLIKGKFTDSICRILSSSAKKIDVQI